MTVIRITDGIQSTSRRVDRIERSGGRVTIYGIYGKRDSRLLNEQYPPGKQTDNWHGVSQSMGDTRAERSEDFPQIWIPAGSPLDVEVIEE